MATVGRKPIPLIERLNSRINKTDSCWVWSGKIDKTGYGSFGMRVEKACRTRTAHKIVYETLVGEVPVDMQLDHLCKNRLCVNPDHLEVVTPRENTLRSNGIAAKNAAKTHCLHGHELSGYNIYVPPKRPDRRYCRKCQNKQITRKRG